MIRSRKQHGADSRRPWLNSLDEVAHPDAPRGSGGPGNFRDARPLLGEMDNQVTAHHPQSPKGHNALDGFEPSIAFAPAGNKPGPKGKAYKHGHKIPAPVKKVNGKWVNVWPIAANPDPDELGSAPSEFAVKANGGKITPFTTGPEVSEALITLLEEIEKEVAAAELEQQETEESIKEREARIAEAEKEREEAKKRLDEATTEEEKTNAQFDVQNAEGLIKQQKGLIKVHETHIEKKKKEVKELEAKIERGIENVRLHEETHLNITAKTAEEANKLLKHEKVAATRQKIIDAADDISIATDKVQDDLLNPISFGSEEDDRKIADWISESSPQNYRSTIKQKFDDLKLTL